MWPLACVSPLHTNQGRRGHCAPFGMMGGPPPTCHLQVREGGGGQRGGGPFPFSQHLSHAPQLVQLGHGEGCALIAHAPNLSCPPAASFVQQGAAHPLVLVWGSPAQFACCLGPPFCTPPPFAHPPIPHKGGHKGGGTHPPPIHACTLPGFMPAWLHVAICVLPILCTWQMGKGGTWQLGRGGVCVHTHLHTLYALPICMQGHKWGTCVPTPHSLHAANRAHGKGGGHTYKGGGGVQGGGRGGHVQGGGVKAR